MGMCLSSQRQIASHGTQEATGIGGAMTPGNTPPAHEGAAGAPAIADRTEQGANLIGQYLRKVPVLSHLTEADRSLLAKELVEKRYQTGQSIIRQGEPGLEFFIIRTGTASVARTDPNTGQSSAFATLTDGDYFGETALINNDTRAATVSAISPTVCLALDAAAFQKLFGKSVLNVQFAKRNAISAEKTKQDNVTPGHNDSNRVYIKSPSVIALIESALSSNVLFSSLDPKQVKEIIAEMYMMEVVSGSHIIKQGDRGDYFYVVEKGEFEIRVSKEGAADMVVASRGPGTSFGELALMYNSPRAASVIAAANGVLWAVNRITFRRILMKVNNEKRHEYENFLKSVPLLSALTASERVAAVEAMEEVSFLDKTVIVEQGAEGETFYVILSGNVDVMIKDGDNPQPVRVQRLGKGEFFGERALLKSEPRAATVIASGGSVDCLVLDRHAFGTVLGPLTDIMQRNLDNYTAESIDQKQNMAMANENPLMVFTLSDFQIIGTLGKGSFGHVQLVKHVVSGDTFALKKVSKAQIAQLGQQDHIMSEKTVMAMLNHPFLIRLRGTLRDNNFLYFLIELCLGGELFSVLRSHVQFDERTARFYAASVVLAFEYMHERDIIYRDLKPENLLLDTTGYLKVTDFGFAKYVADRTWTLCGTPDYLAPEVISGQGHGKAVDWWTLGVLIYEMLVSYPPFYDSDPMRTYSKIMHGSISFPRHVGKDATDLIQRLLHPKAAKRLGAVKGGSRLIKKHPWFKGFDWDALINRTLKPPIIPTVTSNSDLTNFEDYAHQDDDYLPYVDDGTNWDQDF